MKLWKTFNVQKREDISYYNTSEGFETEGFAMHLDRLIREEMAAKGKDGIMFLCINTIQGMGKALPSLILTICRQGLVFIPLILVLNSMFGLDGVIYAQPAADYISIVLSVVICMLIFKNMEHVEKEDLIDQKE